MLNYIPKGR